MRQIAKFLLLTLATIVPGAASAHTGVGDTSGLMHGVMHPIGGVDHLLAMVAVGMVAACLGGRALWLVPAAFVSMMAVGGIVGASGAGLPFVEFGIAASVIVLGIAVALQWNLPTIAAMALVGFFAIFHGHAHGAEMPADASGLSYAFGFMLATALLHAAGIGLAVGVGGLGIRSGRVVMQVAGAGIALAGVAILGNFA